MLNRNTVTWLHIKIEHMRIVYFALADDFPLKWWHSTSGTFIVLCLFLSVRCFISFYKYIFVLLGYLCRKKFNNIKFTWAENPTRSAQHMRCPRRNWFPKRNTNILFNFICKSSKDWGKKTNNNYNRCTRPEPESEHIFSFNFSVGSVCESKWFSCDWISTNFAETFWAPFYQHTHTHQ